MRPARSVLPAVAFALWAGAMVLLCASLLASHLVSLPAPPTDDPALAAALGGASGDLRWRAVHLLSTDCGCSARVLAHLLRRGALPGVGERIVLVTDGAPDAELERSARGRGYAVERLREQDLPARYPVEAVPILLVSDPRGAVRYAGGYTLRKQGPAYQDLEVLRALRAGERVQPLPVFGCAVSARLRAAVDPLGLATPAPRGRR